MTALCPRAVKGGKRYRYYVSARLITNIRSDVPEGTRVPAADIERGVVERLAQFLRNGTAVFEALQPLEPNATRLQQLMRRGDEVAEALVSGQRSDIAPVLRSVVSRIEISSDQVALTVRPNGVLALLRGSGAAEDPSPNTPAAEPGDPLVLSFALLRRRVGRDTRLLVDGEGEAHADPALVNLVIRVQAFRAKLLQSGEASLTDTARGEGISRSYLTRVARLAFLAPEIVCAILDGRQPAQLSVARLSRLAHLPLEWSEQRKLLGFV